MARPERNNVDYFPHPVIHGKKMFYLRSKFKNDGYAVWFMILEELGKSNYHYLDFGDETQMMFLSSQLMVPEEMINDIIESLVKLGEFDKDLWSQRILFCQKFIDSIEDAYSRRSNNVIQKQGLCKHLHGLGRIQQDFCTGINDNKPQSIVKKKIEDKFTPPEFEEVIKYCKERGRGVNAKKWFNHYKANGWKVGANKMVDWKASVEGWEEGNVESKGSNLGGTKIPEDYGKPSENAMTREEYLKSKEEKL